MSYLLPLITSTAGGRDYRRPGTITASLDHVGGAPVAAGAACTRDIRMPLQGPGPR